MSDPTRDGTSAEPPKFDPTAYPADTCFYERRTVNDRRARLTPTDAPPAAERRERKERRRRVDPTTFEKQYTTDELEFMNAMQRFKTQTGRAFPTFAEVLGVAQSLGYRRVPRRVLTDGATLDPTPLPDPAPMSWTHLS